ncbi:MAG: hypothetical protein N3F64_00390 [Nitrososphaeria archaeon]|nr:hypothetical protein [Nitrososphaeria archaeon]
MVFELSSIKDFGRLVCAFEHVPHPVFAFNKSGYWHIFVQYQVDEKKIDYIYAITDRIGAYLGYKNTYGTEIVDFFSTIQNASYIYAPIIFLKNPPVNWFRYKTFPFKKNSLVELEDVSSIVRVATYKMFYEESVLPLFHISNDKLGVLFTILSYGDTFPTKVYYVKTKSIDKNFIKYSSEKNFLDYTNNIEESGFVYAKIIKVKYDVGSGRIWPFLKE